MNSYPRRAAIPFTLLCAVLGLVVGCSSGGGSGSVAAPRTPNTIVIDKFAYAPVALTVAPRTKVTIINQDPASHTVTAKDKSFDSGTIAMGGRGEITAPSKPGSYPYFCTFHQYMAGTLIVK
jgi:plastocyanin